MSITLNLLKINFLREYVVQWLGKECKKIQVCYIVSQFFFFRNLAEALISKGLATCLKHGRNDDQRSSHYDDLLTAENRAIKNNKGLHSKKESTLHRVADVSGVSEPLYMSCIFMYHFFRTHLKRSSSCHFYNELDVRQH